MGPRIDQRLELSEQLAASYFDGTEFGDRVLLTGAGGLQIHDTEGDIRQWPAQILERVLGRPGG